MHLECHAMLGWVIGNIGGADRRLRNYCVVGAILPDIDAIPYVFGAKHYEHFHHTFGHNIFLWALFTLWTGWKCASARAWILAPLSFGSHLLTDAHFSGRNLYLFWPFSRKGFLFPNAVDLSHPSNIQAMYVGFALVVILAFIYRRTPIDVFSPKLDRLFVSFFRPKDLPCHLCPPASQSTLFPLPPTDLPSPRPGKTGLGNLLPDVLGRVASLDCF